MTIFFVLPRYQSASSFVFIGERVLSGLQWRELFGEPKIYTESTEDFQDSTVRG